VKLAPGLRVDHDRRLQPGHGGGDQEIAFGGAEQRPEQAHEWTVAEALLRRQRRRLARRREAHPLDQFELCGRVGTGLSPQQAQRRRPIRGGAGTVADKGGMDAGRLRMPGFGRPAEELAGRGEVAADDLPGEAPVRERVKGIRVACGLRAGKQLIGLSRAPGGEESVCPLTKRWTHRRHAGFYHGAAHKKGPGTSPGPISPFASN